MNPTNILLAIAGYRQNELAAHPFAVTHRRFWLGALAFGSALVGSVLLGIAVSRIEPSHPWRFAFGAFAAIVYFALLLAFDALFIVGSSKPAAKAIGARIILSLLVTAFSSVTMDALIAGKRLDAEIDARRLDADLATRAKHAGIHDLSTKSAAAQEADRAVASARGRLQTDPQTADFVQANARAQAADRAKVAAAREFEPRITQLRAQIAALQSQQNPAAAVATGPRLAELRVRLEALTQRQREIEREATRSATTVQKLRDEWREQSLDLLTKSEERERKAQDQLAAARSLSEQGAAQSRVINQSAFQANVVEQTSAYWALASRDRAYFVVGVVVWLCCLALELLAVLVKLQLAPDEADMHRAHELAEQEARQTAKLQYFEKFGVQFMHIRDQAAQEAEIASAQLRATAHLQETSSQLIVQAWLRHQHAKRSGADPVVQKTLEAQFAAFQDGLTDQLRDLITRMHHANSGAGSAVAAATAHLEPAAVHL
jgi:hypothetical protein